MRETFYPVCISVFIILITASICLSKETSGPRIFFEENTFDAKEIKNGDYIVHTFKVFNKGDSTLEITEVKAACGCTAVKFDKKISPGGEGKITLKVSIKGKNGSIEKTARVYSNDSKNSEEILTVKAVVEELIHVAPSSIRFSGNEGTVLTQSVNITAHEAKFLNIKAGNFTLQDKMTYRIEEIEKGRAFKIVFTNLPLPAGRFHGSLKLMTNYNDKPEITLHISGNFRKETDTNEKIQ